MVADRITYFADVILPLSVPNYYSYRVPHELKDQIKPGQRVIVPFGKHKLYTAIVQKVHQEIPAYEVKYIDHVLDVQPIVTHNQLLFWEWIATYYMCHIGEVMLAALPSSLKLSSETRILRNSYAEQVAESEITDNESLILDALDVNGVLTLEDISNILDRKTIYPLVKKMIDKGLVAEEEELKSAYRPKLKKYIELSDHVKQEGGLEIAFQLLGRAAKQEDLLLQFLNLSNFYEHYKAVHKKELLEKAGYSAAVLKGLLDKNILFERSSEIGRIGPYSGERTAAKELTQDQVDAYEAVKEGFDENKAVLLHGVTGSGKTEIYVQLILDQIAQGKKVLYLLPEIALTTQLITRLRKYFGDKVGVYHSKFSPNERVEVWRSVLDDSLHQYDLIVGARSSIFLPFDQLGLVIVDEEHEYSFKQYDPAPRYHARNAVFKLANLHGSKILLGSATPSLESKLNTEKEVFKLVEIKKRYKGLMLPEIQCADLKTAIKRKEMQGIFSPMLLNEIKEVIENKEQVILFQNRRGYAPKWLCETCGWKTMCTRCDVSLTYHKQDRSMHCHYCGFKQQAPVRCGACGSAEMKLIGFGTEKIEEEIATHLGNEIRVQRMDWDTTRSKQAYHKIIESFENREIDILVGTQMVSKGLDFDHVSLVGILNADDMLYYPDFRAFERSYQLMSQVSGRAGRKKKRGRVIIQSYQPDHWIIQKVMAHDYEGMYQQEIAERKHFQYPPFYRMIKLTVMHKDKEKVDKAGDVLLGLLKEKMGSRILGPEYPSIPRIRNSYLKIIVMKFEKIASPKKVKEFLLDQLAQLKTDKELRSVRVKIDVDPM